jgi:hypothetical protein
MNAGLTEIYPKIRYEVIRKDDPEVLSDNELELAVSQVLEFEFSDFEIRSDNDTKIISPEMDSNNKKLLILKTALSLLVPEDAFSYKTASLSKTLEGTPGLERHIADLRSRIVDIQTDGNGRVCSDDEFGLYYNEPTRTANTQTKAISNG